LRDNLQIINKNYNKQRETFEPSLTICWFLGCIPYIIIGIIIAILLDLIDGIWGIIEDIKWILTFAPCGCHITLQA
jgi:capsular polysaccharide biosynthesis protein